MEFTKYLKIVNKRKWLIIVLVVAALVPTFFLVRRQVPVYTASATLRVVPFLNNLDYGTFVYFERLVGTYTEIAGSDNIVAEARKRLGVPEPQELPDYRIEVVPQTELLRMIAQSPDAEVAAKTANTFAELLVEENKKLYSGSDSPLTALRQRMTDLEKEISTLSAERSKLLDEVPRNTERIAELDRSIESRQLSYNTTSASYNQALVSTSTMSSALNIIEYAKVPDEPGGARLNTNLLIAGIAGLMAGVVLVFVVENLNPRLYSPKQIEQVSGQTVIGKLPRLPRRYRKNVFAGYVPGAEAFRRLRINVVSQTQGKTLSLMTKSKISRTLVVTSAIPKEGKTTVSANLAIALAAAGENVVLIDCDMRRPTLHKLFGLENETGLSNVLNREIGMAQALRESGVKNLKVVTAGPAAFNSAELLGTERMLTIVKDLAGEYDTVIMDGPPLLAATDSAILSANLGGTLLVIDPARTDQRTLQAARDQLESVKAAVLGVVMNRVSGDRLTGWFRYYSAAPRQQKAKTPSRPVPAAPAEAGTEAERTSA